MAEPNCNSFWVLRNIEAHRKSGILLQKPQEHTSFRYDVKQEKFYNRKGTPFVPNTWKGRDSWTKPNTGYQPFFSLLSNNMTNDHYHHYRLKQLTLFYSFSYLMSKIVGNICTLNELQLTSKHYEYCKRQNAVLLNHRPSSR